MINSKVKWKRGARVQFRRHSFGSFFVLSLSLTDSFLFLQRQKWWRNVLWLCLNAHAFCGIKHTNKKKKKRLRRSSSRLWCDGTADAFGHILTGWNPCWPYSTQCLCSTDGGVSLYIYSCLLRWNGTRGASTAQELRILLSLLLLFISDGFFFFLWNRTGLTKKQLLLLVGGGIGAVGPLFTFWLVVPVTKSTLYYDTTFLLFSFWWK